MENGRPQKNTASDLLFFAKDKKNTTGSYFRVPNLRLKKSVTEKTEIVIKSTKSHKKTALSLLMVGTCIL